jgi:uncharacterized protein (DUF2062 family)
MDERKGASRIAEPTPRVWRLLFLHPVRLISELLAEHARPGRLAAAAAFGALVGTLPLPGLHTLLVYVGARRLRLNRIMALGTNQLGLPPLVPALCIELGYYLRHGSLLTEISFRTLGREAPQRFWEWLIGSLVVGPCLAVVAGVAVWLLAALVQRRTPEPPGPPGEAGS